MEVSVRLILRHWQVKQGLNGDDSGKWELLLWLYLQNWFKEDSKDKIKLLPAKSSWWKYGHYSWTKDGK